MGCSLIHTAPSSNYLIIQLPTSEMLFQNTVMNGPHFEGSILSSEILLPSVSHSTCSIGLQRQNTFHKLRDATYCGLYILSSKDSLLPDYGFLHTSVVTRHFQTSKYSTILSDSFATQCSWYPISPGKSHM